MLWFQWAYSIPNEGREPLTPQGGKPPRLARAPPVRRGRCDAPIVAEKGALRFDFAGCRIEIAHGEITPLGGAPPRAHQGNGNPGLVNPRSVAYGISQSYGPSA
jgi:hypothetical protein